MYFAGASGGCSDEPRWSELFSFVAKPDATEAQISRASIQLQEMKPKCLKLLMNSTACYGCEKNPLKDSQDLDSSNYHVYSETIFKVARMRDALRLNVLPGAELTELEFDMVRLYDNQIQARRMV